MKYGISSSDATLLWGVGLGIGGIATTGIYYYFQRRKVQVYSNLSYTRDRNFSGQFSPSGSGFGGNLQPSVNFAGFAENSIAEEKRANASTWLSKSSREQQPSNTDIIHKLHAEEKKLVIVMVGFPGRGKTYISRKIARYLRWIEYRTRVFSIAKYRLDKLGNRTAEFFDPNNESNYQARLDILQSALEDACRYLERGGNVAIIDGTHTTRDRRNLIREELSVKRGLDILWIESICDNETIIGRHSDELCESPDYIDRFDFAKRIQYYLKSYEKLEESEGSFIKVYDCGRKLDLHLIHGYLRTKIVSFVMNLHTVPRQVYLVRCGESTFNEKNLIGGDSSLSSRGIKFAKALSEYFSQILSDSEENTGSAKFNNRSSDGGSDGRGGIPTRTTEKDDDMFGDSGIMLAKNFNVWTSTLRRARETALILKEGENSPGQMNLSEWRILRDLEVGICDGLSYDQVKANWPDEYRGRAEHKLRYRYPRGESYLDILNRLEPVIFEMERTTAPLIIVAHQAVLRCLYAYFLDFPHDELPFLSVPLHTLIRLEPGAYGCKEKRLKFVLDDDVPEPLSPRY